MKCDKWDYLDNLLRKVAKEAGVLPDQLTVRGVVKISRNPVAVGGFADILRGRLGRERVALKVFRVYGKKEDIKRDIAVRSHQCLVHHADTLVRVYAKK